MIKVEAPSLQEAYSKAAAELSCSVVDLEITILQNGSAGFLGMFKKMRLLKSIAKEQNLFAKRLLSKKPIQRKIVQM